MALDGQLVFAFAEDKGLGADSPLSMRLRLGRLRFAEELSAQQATVDQAWQPGRARHLGLRATSSSTGTVTSSTGTVRNERI